MITELFLALWAVCALGAAFIIAGVFAACANRERHFQRLRQEADEAAERHARNSTFPKDGKTVRILQ